MLSLILWIATLANTILLIDDSPTLRTVLGALLTDSGYQVIEAENGHTAMSIIHRKPFDLVLCDINMPVMDGISFIQSFKQEPQMRHIPVLVLSTENSNEMKLKAKFAGASGWIVKPYKEKTILEAINKLIG